MDLDKIRKKLKNMKIFNHNLIFVLKTIATIIFVISMNIHLMIMGLFGFIYYCTALFIKLFYK